MKLSKNMWMTMLLGVYKADEWIGSFKVIEVARFLGSKKVEGIHENK